MAYTIRLHFKFRESQKVTFRGALDSAITNATEYMRIHKADAVQVIDDTDTVVFSKPPHTSAPDA